MRDTMRSFSHPVLSPYLDDFRDSTFEFSASGKAGDGYSYYLGYEFSIDHPDLYEMLKAEKAGLFILLESKSVFYREMISLGPKGLLKIPGDMVSGRIDCLPLMVAMCELDGYSPQNMHEDYEGESFSLQTGDVIAMGRSFWFDAEKQYDPLREISSIMQVIQDESLADGEMKVDLLEDKITIDLSPRDHAKYTELGGLSQLSSVFVHTLALPALVQAIEVLMNDRQVGCRWETLLGKKLKAMRLNGEKDNSVHVASRVLDASLSNALDQLERQVGGLE